jgi:hypothetical protein
MAGTEAPRTIEEIEARAAAIERAEYSALNELVRGLRELAVALPEGSGLALTFAGRAKSIEQVVERRLGIIYGEIDVNMLARTDLERHWRLNPGGEIR